MENASALLQLAGPLHGFLLYREGEGEARAHVGLRAAIDPSLPHPHVQRQVIPDLPDCPAEHGEPFFHAELTLVNHFGDGADGPIVRSFEDRSHEQVGVVIARQRSAHIEVHRSPRPALRDDAEPARGSPLISGSSVPNSVAMLGPDFSCKTPSRSTPLRNRPLSTSL